MMKFNMISGNFGHAKCSTWYKTANSILWDFGSKNNSVSFYIDGDIHRGFSDINDGKRKFLWTLESRWFNSNVFDTITNNLQRVLDTYELIFTYNDELCKLDPKFKWVPAMGFWIENPKIDKKTKLLSMIASTKTMTEQQKFRVNFANDNKEKFDLFGFGRNSISVKETGLVDYMFSVCIENDTFDTYFTEKVLDCFATGTIPVFKGTRQIVKHFNSDGIIFLDDTSIDNLSEDLYYSKLYAVKDNFEKVLPYNTLEDWMYEKHLKNLF